MAKLQLEDFLRHGGQSRKSKQHSKFHDAALRYERERQQHESSPAHAGSDDFAAALGVTPCHIWISLQILHTPTSAQADEFSRRCVAQHALSPDVCPLARSGPKTHWKILRSLSDVLFEQDRAVVLEGLLSVGLVQDPGGISEDSCLLNLWLPNSPEYAPIRGPVARRQG